MYDAIVTVCFWLVTPRIISATVVGGFSKPLLCFRQASARPSAEFIGAVPVYAVHRMIVMARLTVVAFPTRCWASFGRVVILARTGTGAYTSLKLGDCDLG
jgi:hypothetical protein